MPKGTVAPSATQFLPIVKAKREPGRLTSIAERASLAPIYLLIITVVVFQRFIIPGLSEPISIALPVVFLTLVGLAVRGHLVTDVFRTGLYLAAVAACLLANLIVMSNGSLAASLNSILFLAVIYMPLCFRTSAAVREQFPQVLAFFQGLMVIAASICVLQTAIQFAGVSYEDPITKYVPPDLIYGIGYNNIYPVSYGSSILKSNGIIFLEPSFASQFMALAIIIQILMGNRRWRLALFGAALLSTVSGTGIALLGAGIVVLAVRRGGQWTVRTVLGLAVVVIALSFTTVGALLSERTGEGAEVGSSGNARFVAPYQLVSDAIGRDTETLLVGRGAGSIDDKVEIYFNPGAQLVNYPPLPKLIGEYGLPAGLLFFAFVLAVFLHNVPSTTLGIACVVNLFVLSGALLQPQTVYLCWILTGLFAASRAGEVLGRRTTLPSSVEEKVPWGPRNPVPAL